MALTVVQFETILIKRTGTLLTAVGLDGSTIDGDNPDLVDPMGFAIRHMGGTIATITDIIDADLATFEETDYDELFDIAELRVLNSCHSAAVTMIDTEIGSRTEDFAAMAERLEKLIEAKQKQVDTAYLSSQWTLNATVVDYDFSTLD